MLTARESADFGFYGKFLDLCREQARVIKFQCEQAGFEISDLPRRLDQSQATVATLLNQYIWFRYAARRSFPKYQEIHQWLKWSRRGTA
jgi:hypothetical protein